MGDRNTALRLEFCPGWLSEAKVTTHPGVHDTQVMMRQRPGGVPGSSPGSAQRRRAVVWHHGREMPEQHSKETWLRVQQKRQTRTQKQSSRPEGQQKRRQRGWRAWCRTWWTSPNCFSTTLNVNGHGPSVVSGTHQIGCKSET